MPGGAWNPMFWDLVGCEWDDDPEGVNLNCLPEIFVSLKYVQTTHVRFGQPDNERSTDGPILGFQLVIKHRSTCGVRQNPWVICMLDLMPRVIEQDGMTYLEVGAVVTDHALQNLGMEKRSIKEGGKSLLEGHPL